MKKVLTFILSILILQSCGCANIKSIDGIFIDDFQCKKQSPWINNSKRYLVYTPIPNSGLKITNISKKYHAGVNYNKFPVKMMNDFESILNFSMLGKGNFTFYLGYKDAEHRELFSFSEIKQKMFYSRYDGKRKTERVTKDCFVKQGVNKLKLIKKENEIFLYLNDQLLMNIKNKSTFSNSFGFGLGSLTSVLLKDIRITEI